MFAVSVTSLTRTPVASAIAIPSAVVTTDPGLPVIDTDLADCPHYALYHGKPRLYHRAFDSQFTTSRTVCIIALPAQFAVGSLFAMPTPTTATASTIATSQHQTQPQSQHQPQQLSLSNVTLIDRIVDPVTSQHTLIIEFLSNDQASLFHRSINANQFGGGASSSGEICYAIILNNYAKGENVSGSGIELPLCPRCLVRIDTSMTGIITPIYTQKYSASLTSTVASTTAWSEIQCNVCELLNVAKANTSAKSPIQCEWCEVSGDVRESLWICLLCGHTGCGRYFNGHAYDHFVATQHRFTIELLHHYVWDYQQDGFIHRVHGREEEESNTYHNYLQQSSAASLPGGRTTASLSLTSSGSTATVTAGHTSVTIAEYGQDAMDDSDDQALALIKCHSISSYYDQLLSSQLVQQCEFFEAKLADALSESEMLDQKLSSFTAHTEHEIQQLSQMIDERKNQSTKLAKSNENLKKKIAQQQSEVSLLNEINANLAMNREPASSSASGPHSPDSSSAVTARIRDKDRRIAALEKQIATIMKQMT